MSLQDNLIVSLNQNNNWKDSSGNGNHASPVGATFDTVNQKLGIACGDFALDDYVDLNNNYQSVFQDSFTIALWLRPTDGQEDRAQDYFGLLDTNDRVRIFTAADNGLRFQYLINGNNYIANAGVQFSDGQETWHLIWCEADNVANELRIYFDNSLVETETGVTEPFANYGGTLSPFLGAVHKSTPVASSFYDGQEDAFAMWDTIKSSTDRDAYWNGDSGIELNPVIIHRRRIEGC